MTKTMLKTQYTLHTLQNEHIESAIHLFTKSFCDSEPLTKHLAIQYDEYEPFARAVVQKAAREGMSKVAVGEQNRVIACCIAEDITNPFIPNLKQYPRLAPVFTLLHTVSKPFLTGKKFFDGKLAHVWIAIVDESHRGQGLSTVIDTACTDMLARKGYNFIYAEFTNEISERIIHQYPLFLLCHKITYADFTMENGEQPFKGLKGRAAAYVMVLKSGISLDLLEDCYQIEERYATK